MPFPHRKFRKLRIELGLSRAEVAEKAGLATRYLEHLEQGTRPNPTQDTIEGLCKALGVGCDFFFSDDISEDEAPKPGPGRPSKHK